MGRLGRHADLTLSSVLGLGLILLAFGTTVANDPFYGTRPMDGIELPVTRYALSGDVSIAYQVMGDGPGRYYSDPRFHVAH
jgi:hypothetical protein